MATIVPHARRQLDQLDLDIDLTNGQIWERDQRIIVALQKCEDIGQAENEAEILRIVLEDMKALRRRILRSINGDEPTERAAQSKRPIESRGQARRSQ